MTENKKKTFSQNESNLLAKDEIKQMVENKRQQALRLRKQKLEEKKTNNKTDETAENNSTSKDLRCEECRIAFHSSYLYQNFDKVVCDSCRDSEEAHRLITRTEAKETYLLKDCDFDFREPVLKFISRKNKQKKFGEMKLYLECQVADRASEVWGSDEGLEKEKEKRMKDKDKNRKRKMEKQMKYLNKLSKPGLLVSAGTTHKHEYGAETYNEEEDTYSKVCKTCNHTMTYEKM